MCTTPTPQTRHIQHRHHSTPTPYNTDPTNTTRFNTPHKPGTIQHRPHKPGRISGPDFPPRPRPARAPLPAPLRPQRPGPPLSARCSRAGCCAMAAAPAESSRSPGKGLEWSQSLSSSALDYSGDTFESFSEEEEESEAPGSWCSTEDLEGAAVSEALESSASLAGQSAAEEEFEAVDPAAVERAAIRKWIDAMRKWIDLKNKDTGIRPDKSVSRTPAGAAERCQAGLAARGPWCSCRSCRRLPWGAPARHTEPAESCAVPAQLMNRILLENTREALKQVTEAEIHEVSTCPDCQQKEAELAKAAFLRKKKTLLEGALIQEKLEEQFYSRDMLTLLGEALRSFPKPSEDPRDLWQRLKAQEWKD